MWQVKGLAADFSDVWQIKELQTEGPEGNGTDGADGDGIEESQHMIGYVYGFVKTQTNKNGEQRTKK